MCFLSNGDAARAAQQQAAQQSALIDKQSADRNAAVTEGKSNIDKAFGQFDQPYYDAYKTSFINKYTPALDD
jgi:hypothetical protein